MDRGKSYLERALDWHRSGEHEKICAHHHQLLEHALRHPTDADTCLQLLFIGLVRAGTAELATEFAQWLTKCNQFDLARQCLSHFIGLTPENPFLWAALSNLFVAEGNRDSALEAMNHAVSHLPSPSFRMQLVHLLGEIGKAHSALAELDKIPSEDRNLRWLWLKASIFPVVFASSAEQQSSFDRCSDGLDVLLNAVESADDAACSELLYSITSLFSLQYLCHPREVVLQSKYAAVLEALMRRCFPDRCRPVTNQTRAKSLRIGVVTGFFRKHTVVRLYLPLLRHLANGPHTLVGFSIGREDDWTPQLSRIFSSFHHLGNQSLSNQVELIAAEGPDLLFFPELGMNARCLKLAALRLAPVQAVGWGHPVTTGLSTVDYFVSGAAMEPENGQQWYTENLVCLDGPGLSLAPPVSAARLRKIKPYPLPAARFRFLVSQSIFKLLPEHDVWFAKLMAPLSESQIVFLAGEGVNAGEKFRERIKSVFKENGVSSDCLVFAPRMLHDDFIALNLACDVFIDGISWSGGMTTMEALQCGLVPMTIPGQQMRTRHTHAFVQELELPQLSVANQEEWLELGHMLANDEILRLNFAEQIKERLPRLWRQSLPLEEFDMWLRSL